MTIFDDMKFSQRLSLVLLTCTVSMAACGSEEPMPPVVETSVFPVTIGNRWEFRLTSGSGNISTKIQTVTGTAAGGAFAFETDRGDRITRSVQQMDAQGRLIRISEQGFDMGMLVEDVTYSPPAIRVDTKKATLGATYEQTFEEVHNEAGGVNVSKVQRFVVEAVDESVTVPAGTFQAVRVKRSTVGGPEKTYWYAPGTGKVKEIGGQVEELVRVDIVTE